MACGSDRRVALLLLASLLSLLVGLLCAAPLSPVGHAAPAGPSSGGMQAHLPLAMRGFAGDYPRPVVPTEQDPQPSASSTLPPSASPGASATSTPTVAASTTPTVQTPDPAHPTPTPTLVGQEVRYPRNPNTIILQIGRTDTTEITQVHEEMNGTPWFTLYGDGTLIAGRQLFDNLQPLFQVSVDEQTVQRWLRRLVNTAGFYALEGNYHHPRASTPEVHVYAYTNDGAKRVSLRSFKQFEQWGVPETYASAQQAQELVSYVRALEAELLASRVPVDATPYAAECFTILAQQAYGWEDMAGELDKWEYSLNIRAVAEAAPTAASNYEDKVVGHKFVGADIGREIRSVIEPQWRYWFPDYKIAALFKIASRPYAVGARQEVPGGSLFLPDGGFDNRGYYWYRRDPGSGSCGGLGRLLLQTPGVDPAAWIARVLALP